MLLIATVCSMPEALCPSGDASHAKNLHTASAPPALYLMA